MSSRYTKPSPNRTTDCAIEEPERHAQRAQGECREEQPLSQGSGRGRTKESSS